jgi:3-dehydrotetronate 4-kinase
MLLGCIADDFTGASDLANTLAHGGMRTTQYVGAPKNGVPTGGHGVDSEAGVVALKSRSIAPDQAVALSLAALDWLKDQGCRQFLFKYCSTFDSTHEGNIGPVGEALADALGVKGVVACPAFPTLGRSVYQGHLFVRDRLLSESGMENHPLMPMTDPDLRRWLARQARSPVGHVAWPVVASGPDAIRAALAASGERGETLAIVDAIEDRDLVAIGAASAEAPLLTGGSGIALGLPENFRRAGLLSGRPSAFAAAAGPAAVIAGSCSAATQAQVGRFLKDHPGLGLDIDGLMDGKLDAERALAFMLEHLDSAPLCYSTDAPEAVQAHHRRHGRDTVAARVEAFFGTLAAALVERGVRRLVVAGGETSGAVVTALRVTALEIGPEIDPGVPALSTTAAGRPLSLALKSGNFGGPDFFEKALAALGGGR